MGQKEVVIVEDHKGMLYAICVCLSAETKSSVLPLLHSGDIEKTQISLAEIIAKNPEGIAVVCDGLHGDYKKILIQCKNAQVPFMLHSGECNLIAEAKANHVSASLKDGSLDGIKNFLTAF